MAAHAFNIKRMLWDFDERLRGKLKYSEDYDGDTLAAVKEQFYRCLEQHNVRLHQ